VAKSHGVTSLTKLGSKSTELPTAWCAASRSGRAVPRRRSTEIQVLRYLARLVANLPDPAELAARCDDWETTKAHLNESHSSERKLFP